MKPHPERRLDPRTCGSIDYRAAVVPSGVVAGACVREPRYVAVAKRSGRTASNDRRTVSSNLAQAVGPQLAQRVLEAPVEPASTAVERSTTHSDTLAAAAVRNECFERRRPIGLDARMMAFSDDHTRQRPATEDAVSTIVLVLGTAPTAEAEQLARELVEGGLVACVNLIPGVRSIYQWRGAVCDEPEVVLLMKTCCSKLAELESAYLDRHSYDTPEFVVLGCEGGHKPYLEWVLKSVGG